MTLLIIITDIDQWSTVIVDFGLSLDLCQDKAQSIAHLDPRGRDSHGGGSTRWIHNE
jgi:hypothetical protein